MMKLIAAICLVLFTLTGTAYPEEPAISIGIAVQQITPPVPYRMSGYFSERLSTGVKDPLYAKAIVFKQGGISAAIVFCDIIGISADLSQSARRLVTL